MPDCCTFSKVVCEKRHHVRTSLADSLPDFLLAALACGGRPTQSSTLASMRSDSSADPQAHAAWSNVSAQIFAN